MPKLSWNETRDRAIRFSRDWNEARREEQDKQTFWNEFFDIFGIPRKSVAVFEHAVANARGAYGFLDLFWPGVLLVEHKSSGASLAKAESQAFAYLNDLARQGRHDELPRYVILCDFVRFALYDLEPDAQSDLPLFDDGRPFRLTEFNLRDLHRHIREFAFMRGEKTIRTDPEDPANLKATRLLADLHDALDATGYRGHALERYLVRLLFCLFAEDTAIFDAPGMFTALIERTREDAADLGPLLAQLWDVLNTDTPARQTSLDEDLAAFPYVNGGLFAEPLPVCSFSRDLRNALLACCRFHWAKISPAVFGSLFQGILAAPARRQIGAHYTSERDIMKVIRSLFHDDLRAALDTILADRSTRRSERLRDFQKKLRSLRLLDPACGCGNFLILAYRELRRLENQAVIALHRSSQLQFGIRELVQVDVDQFYGIEIGEWPARIAEVGLWLADHQCNLELAEALGKNFNRLPLRATPTIRIANALRTDWRDVLPPEQCSYILGNPPFVGKHYQTEDQKADLRIVFGDFKNIGDLDYVTAWYLKACEYIRTQPHIRCAFVSTNSITQGEQVPVLWRLLFERFHIKIYFAHRTFQWASEAKGKAHVHVVIIGFGLENPRQKFIYDYTDSADHPIQTITDNISPYLTPGSDAFVTKRSKPLADVPEMRCGNKPTDNGSFLLTDSEKTEFLQLEPDAAPYLRRYTGSEEFINGNMRWCLWLKDADPAALRKLPEVMKRIEAVRNFRLKSSAKPTREAATRPAEFFYINQPSEKYIAIPEVSSERRAYIPIGLLDLSIISSNKIYILPTQSLFLFGALSSSMHMAWMRIVAGRLESRYQYSGSMVYNTFPWPFPERSVGVPPASPSPSGQDARAPVRETDISRLITTVETCAQAILDTREQFPNSTLADLYDPLTMPAPLAKAHAALDRAVDRCYRRAPFTSDRERVEHLFALYNHLTTPLIPPPAKRKK